MIPIRWCFEYRFNYFNNLLIIFEKWATESMKVQKQDCFDFDLLLTGQRLKVWIPGVRISLDTTRNPNPNATIVVCWSFLIQNARK